MQLERILLRTEGGKRSCSREKEIRLEVGWEALRRVRRHRMAKLRRNYESSMTGGVTGSSWLTAMVCDTPMRDTVWKDICLHLPKSCSSIWRQTAIAAVKGSVVFSSFRN
jgi:hypothetical protein